MGVHQVDVVLRPRRVWLSHECNPCLRQAEAEPFAVLVGAEQRVQRDPQP